jgi:hypothetical protein
MLNVVQTVAIIAAVLVSGYAIVVTERNRRLDASHARIERVLAAVIALAEAALRAQMHPETELPPFQVAKLRLGAELKVVGVRGFEAADLMTRPDQPEAVVRQSEQAIIEIGERLNRLD